MPIDPASAALAGFLLFSGTATDRLGERLGGISSLRWDEARQELLALPDRGPLDGAVPYAPRFHVFSVELSSAGFSARLDRSILFRDAAGQPFSGMAASTGPRLDPEGLALAPDGTLWVSEEYGPAIYHFDREGALLGRLEPPEDYLPGPGRGREDNKGFEGLCLTSGGRLAALLQSPLAQDGGAAGKEGRLLVYDLAAGTAPPREFRVPRADAAALGRGLLPKDFGFNEIEAVSETEFLILERDNRGAGEAGAKAVPFYKRALRLALDDGGTARVAPFMDLLEAAVDSGIASRDLSPKFESLAWGPTRNGRRTLWSALDNDFIPELPTVLFLFDAAGPTASEAGRP